MLEGMAANSANNDERETRILEAAGRLIVYYGYDKTTVADIAQEAEVSKGAIYLHFKSKDELLEGLVLYETKRVVGDMLARIEADPDGGTFFSLYISALLALAANPLMRALTTHNKRILGDALRRINQSPLYSEGKMFTIESIQQFQAAGLLRTDLAPGVIIYYLSIIRYGLLMVDDVLPPEDVPSLDEFGPVLADTIARALAPQGGGDKEAGKRAIAHLVEMTQQMVSNKQRRSAQE